MIAGSLMGECIARVEGFRRRNWKKMRMIKFIDNGSRSFDITGDADWGLSPA